MIFDSSLLFCWVVNWLLHQFFFADFCYLSLTLLRLIDHSLSSEFSAISHRLTVTDGMWLETERNWWFTRLLMLGKIAMIRLDMARLLFYAVRKLITSISSSFRVVAISLATSADFRFIFIRKMCEIDKTNEFHVLCTNCHSMIFMRSTSAHKIAQFWTYFSWPFTANSYQFFSR